MSYVRTAAMLCACVVAANIVASPAPAPPRREENKDSESMTQEKTIVIRRVPNAYVYPFSLWPLQKYHSVRDDSTVEYIYNGKTFKKVKVVEQNRR